MRSSAALRLFGRSYIDAWFLLLMTLGLLLAFWIAEPAWLNSQTAQTLLAGNAPLALVAVAMTFAIISRHIDLSPGSMIALVGAVIGLVWTADQNLLLALLAGCGVALAVGLVNGYLVGYLGLNAIMVTLAAYIWARGLAVGAKQGNPIVVGGGLADVVNASWGGLTIAAPIVIVAYVGGAFLLARTKMGRYTYAMGGDPGAARRAGINAGWYTVLIFLLMAVMIAVSAILTVGQLGSAQPTAGTGLELDAIIAVVIGGTRLAGGEGNVGRTALGVVFLSVLNSGLSSLGLSDSAYELYRGIALLSVLTVQVIVRRLTDVEERRLRTREQLAALAT
jgi:ribose/xylose/arabinose/galactoside ABC-type transport system permease subunit